LTNAHSASLKKTGMYFGCASDGSLDRAGTTPCVTAIAAGAATFMKSRRLKREAVLMRSFLLQLPDRTAPKGDGCGLQLRRKS
jgi:hypothetical protein